MRIIRLMSPNVYKKGALITTIATLFLILVGGTVRGAGAGLGCPDWPKCFGRWIPPLSAADLPPGFDVSQFNVWQTWLEYINRLIGVTVGLLIIYTAYLAFRIRKSQPIIFYCAVSAVFLVAFQGWLGGVVVKSELESWLITAHLIIALVIVNLLMFTIFKVSDKPTISLNPESEVFLKFLSVLLLVVSLIQVVLGTRVRELIEISVKNTPDLPRSEWLMSIGALDYVHRSSSWAVLILTLMVFYFVWKRNLPEPFQALSKILLVIVVLQILFGTAMAYLSIPPIFQVLHMFFASLMICAQFIFILFAFSSRRAEKVVEVNS